MKFIIKKKMKEDSEQILSQFSSEKSFQCNKYIPNSSNKCVYLIEENSQVRVGSKYKIPESIDMGLVTDQNICQIYQRKTTSEKHVKFSGSGIIVQTLLHSRSKISFQSNPYCIIGLVLSCSHLTLNLEKPIWMTTGAKIPDKDHFQLIPIFKQDYTTRTDTFSDPVTQAAVSANDVNLFLLVVLDDEPNDIRLQLKRVKPKVNFMKKEDIKPGLEVYLGAYSTPSQDKKKGTKQELYIWSPGRNKEYLQAKEDWLRNPENQKAEKLVKSFQTPVEWSQVFSTKKAFYEGEILEKNNQMAAASYSCQSGSSGGPLLHFKDKEVFIVGVNHGSAAVGDYCY